jgi:hypothetical protein
MGPLGWCLCTLLVPEQLDLLLFISFIKNLAIIGHCLVNMNSLAPKIGAPEAKLWFSPKWL